MDYFTLVRIHLAESRRSNPHMQFAGAWARAMKAHPKPPECEGYTPAVMEFARVQFSHGYYRQGGGAVAALAEAA